MRLLYKNRNVRNPRHTDSSIFLLSIYDKSEKEDIDDKELLRLLNIVK